MSKCKHLVKATVSHLKPRRYDAHIRRHDVTLLRRFLDPNDIIANYDLLGDGFDVTFRHGANGSVLVTFVERDNAAG